jgi:hypothetical protein
MLSPEVIWSNILEQLEKAAAAAAGVVAAVSAAFIMSLACNEFRISARCEAGNVSGGFLWSRFRAGAW